jgi:DNA processing protein
LCYNFVVKNIPYLLALHSINGLGPIRLKRLLDHFTDPKLVWETDGKKLRELGIPQPTIDLFLETRKKLDPQKFLEEVESSGIKYKTIFDEDYPKLLKQIHDPSLVFYYLGEILPTDGKAIAVVGTRKITGYGKAVTEDFTKGLVSAGLTIVSGLARGVDTIAHQTALDNNGRTLAILGGGLNLIFPPENVGLARKIADGSGAVISEFPPDYPSTPGNFPARNRIISGLSIATLVTEAAEDSGSLITAHLAIEQGRDVFAVPGPVTSTLSKGPVSLIKDGARIVMEPGEILDELGLSRRQATGTRQQLELSTDEKKILESLINESKHIDEICRELGFSAAIVSGILLKLEILGAVRSLGGGQYSAS